MGGHGTIPSKYATGSLIFILLVYYYYYYYHHTLNYESQSAVIVG